MRSERFAGRTNNLSVIMFQLSLVTVMQELSSSLCISTQARRTMICAACLVLVFFCLQVQADTPHFAKRQDRGLIEYDPIAEASGIVASRKNADVLWTHNDSGRKNTVFAVSTHGKHLGLYILGGIKNRDWEDIAIGPGSETGQQYLYIGDIGDNRANHDLKYIYRVPEPDVRADQKPTEVTLADVETITFRYPDGQRDAETLLIDPISKDLYVISKRETRVRVYRASYPQSVTLPITLEHVASLAINEQDSRSAWLTGGDISFSGHEILLKSYVGIYYWPRISGQPVHEALTTEPVLLPYIPEPQGEAICWKADGSGYYTVSEEQDDVPAHLYFYPRLQVENTD